MTFYKYHGAGNDFIMIDNRDLIFPKEDFKIIAKMCHRRFGIGADGLILLENHSQLDFKMVYFNADGKEGSMCGNGGRCIVAFAKQLGVIKNITQFEAVDGLHEATIDNDIVSLKMKNVKNIEQLSENTFFLDTGSPHYVKIVEEMPEDFIFQAKEIRNSKRFKVEGVNVNFIAQKNANTYLIRTFERGVEDETYACGTGAVAAALVTDFGKEQVFTTMNAIGGDLHVDAEKVVNEYQNIWLKGTTVNGFSGEWDKRCK